MEALRSEKEEWEVKHLQEHYEALQIDELWTFVNERKRKKWWVLYAYASETEEIAAWSWGN